MADRKRFDPTDLMMSSLDEVLDGITSAFTSRRPRSSSTYSSTLRDSDKTQKPNDDDDYDYYDADSEDGSSYYASAGDESAQTTAMPDDIRSAYEQLNATLSNASTIESEDILKFCSDKRNWPTLKWLLKVGIAVVGVAVLIAILSAATEANVASADTTQAESNKKENSKSFWDRLIR
jgi:hypothetical protein